MEARRRQIRAMRRGDYIELRLPADRRAIQAASAPATPLLPRLLAAVQSGIVLPEQAKTMLEQHADLTSALVDFADAQAGDITVGDVVAGDQVVINVYVGGKEVS